MSVGKNIKAHRERLGISQVEMSEKLGISQPMLCQIEKDRKAPSLMLSKEIAEIFNCSVDSLLDGDAS